MVGRLELAGSGVVGSPWWGRGAGVEYLLKVQPWVVGLWSGLVVPGHVMAQGQQCLVLQLLVRRLFLKVVLARVDVLAGLLVVRMLALYQGSSSRQPANPPFDSSSPAHAV